MPLKMAFSEQLCKLTIELGLAQEEFSATAQLSEFLTPLHGFKNSCFLVQTGQRYLKISFISLNNLYGMSLA